MPIRRIKAQSPDPYLGKIKGDTELARLAHLNYVIDEINNGNGGGSGGSITVNGDGPVSNLIINSPNGTYSYNSSTDTYTVIIDEPAPFVLPYKAYRAKIAMQTVDWPGYGYLYNWYAVDDLRGLANPAGGTGLTAPNEWRVPSDTDWNTLATFAGGSSVAGGKLKSTLNSDTYPFYGWSINGGGTDDYNFSALAGGYRGFLGPSVAFQTISTWGRWWTSVSTSLTGAEACSIDAATSSANIISENKSNGYSVRLVREATAGELLLNDGDTSDTSSLDPYTGNDGKTYVTVKIGTQIWLAQNLRETKYNDNSNIFNAASGVYFPGGDGLNSTWEAKGIAQEGAWTAYLFNPGTGSVPVEYDPTTVKLFYNDVLENTLDLPPGFPVWISGLDANGPTYFIGITGRYWNKTHIKITPGYDVSDFPTINERSLLIEDAYSLNTNIISFRPTKRDNIGAITIEDLNNYRAPNAPGPYKPVSYVYVEILEYTPTTPYYNQLAGIGASNLEEEEEIVALTYEINGVTYTEDLEAKKLSIEIAKIYDQLGIFDKYKV